MRYSLFTLLFVGLLAASCASIGASSGTDRDNADDARPDASERVADFESFDPSPYEETPPRAAVEINHQVPSRLMQGTAVEGVRRTVEGFRIQIFSTQEKRLADRRLEETLDWWEQSQSEAPEGLFRDDLSAIIEYGQPYYRVRIGAFEERNRAERALEFVKRQYPDAFIARTTVTVTE